MDALRLGVYVFRDYFGVGDSMININKLQTIDERTIDCDQIQPLVYSTEEYKLKNAYKLGALHAQNHYYDEELDVNFPVHVKGWNVNPYSSMRPGVFFQWSAGFTETYGNLLRIDGVKVDNETP